LSKRSQQSPAARAPKPARKSKPKLTIAIVTGTRAEFGLLRPVIDAIGAHPRLKLALIAAGAHFLPPARTIREVESAYPIAARVPMQRAAAPRTRHEDALATSRGIAGFATTFAKLKPHWVVVLGDRIEAFAAAAASSIAGIPLCHIHGGDRAEGIADEALRHAISKLAHLHCAATEQSAQRLLKMGESQSSVHVTGSPAVDGLAKLKPLTRAQAAKYGDPKTILLLHPSGLSPQRESLLAASLIHALDEMSAGDVVCLAPNHDPGRDYILRAITARCAVDNHRIKYQTNPPSKGGGTTFTVLPRPSSTPACGLVRRFTFVEHLPRASFIALLKYAAHSGVGLLAGNSSAGMIEAAALNLRVLNLGPRQSGRERHPLVTDVALTELDSLPSRVMFALDTSFDTPPPHPFTITSAGAHIAKLLATTNPAPMLRKHNSY